MSHHSLGTQIYKLKKKKLINYVANIFFMRKINNKQSEKV